MLHKVVLGTEINIYAKSSLIEVIENSAINFKVKLILAIHIFL